MIDKHAPAQQQDKVYSIGGGSLYVGYQEGEAIPETAVLTVEESAPEYPAEIFVIDIEEPEPKLFTPEPEIVITEPVKLPWYRHLWAFLNMDVREVWKLIWRK